MKEKEIRNIVYNITKPSTYKTRYTLIKILLVVFQNPEYSKKEINFETAKQLSCDKYSIRTYINRIIEHIWNNNRFYLFEIAGSCLKQKPSPEEFIDYLITEINRNDKYEPFALRRSEERYVGNNKIVNELQLKSISVSRKSKRK